MKTIIILISIFVFSLFFNVFTLSLIGDYEEMIARLPNIAQKSFINGCNQGIIKYDDKTRVQVCQKLADEYIVKFNKFLDQIK